MTKAPKSKHGWHITNRKLKYRDNREVYEGEALKVKGQPVVCSNGMHAEPLLNLCLYKWRQRGKYICRVVVRGNLSNDYYRKNTKRICFWDKDNTCKFVGQQRKVLAMVHKQEFYAALMELFNKYPNQVVLLREKEAIQVFKRAVELRDMIGLDYHKRKK